MAAIWTVSIEVTNVALKQCNVTMVRTDDADPENPFRYTTAGHVDTTCGLTLVQIRDRFRDQAVAAYQAWAAKQDAVAAIAATYESALATALNAEEPL